MLHYAWYSTHTPTLASGIQHCVESCWSCIRRRCACASAACASSSCRWYQQLCLMFWCRAQPYCVDCMLLQDIEALASCSNLQRLHLSCKCPRAPPIRMDWRPWLALSSLKHLHMHINPAWRDPLQVCRVLQWQCCCPVVAVVAVVSQAAAV